MSSYRLFTISDIKEVLSPLLEETNRSMFSSVTVIDDYWRLYGKRGGIIAAIEALEDIAFNEEEE